MAFEFGPNRLIDEDPLAMAWILGQCFDSWGKEPAEPNMG